MRIAVTLQRARDWADFGVKLLTMVAIVVGGYWAYFQFRVTRTDVTNVQLTVVADVLPYSTESRLLLIHVKPKNVGKVLVDPPQAFSVTVRNFPTDVKGGIVDIDKHPNAYPPIDLLRRFPDGYELEPGIEYDELVAIVVPKGTMYSVKAQFDFDKETEVDHTAIVRID